MSADARLKSFIDRVLRLKDEQDNIASDIREVYAQAAGEGYNKTTMGQLVTYLRKREKNGEKLAEQSALFDLYLQAYERPSHAHTREGSTNQGGKASGPVDPSTESVSPNVRDYQGGSDANKGGDHVTASGNTNLDKKTISPAESEANEISATNSHSSQSSSPETDTAGAETPPTAPAAPLTDDFTPPAFLFKRKTAQDYRPHCQHPEACGSSKLDHCYSCRKALEARDESEAA